jgi:hypothetical protein
MAPSPSRTGIPAFVVQERPPAPPGVALGLQGDGLVVEEQAIVDTLDPTRSVVD